MELLINIFLMIAPFILGVILSTIENLTITTKLTVWVICLVICIVGVIKEIQRRKIADQQGMKMLKTDTSLRLPRIDVTSR